ncbi:MAG: hypothetical protein RLZ81_3225, partial [Pseudomonadota bacterium]
MSGHDRRNAHLAEQGRRYDAQRLGGVAVELKSDL